MNAPSLSPLELSLAHDRQEEGAAAEVAKRLASRTCCNGLRSGSCPIAGQARRRNAAAPPRLIELARRPQLAPVARPPLGSSQPWSRLKRAMTCRGPRTSFPRASQQRPAVGAPRPLPRRTGTCPSLAFTLLPSPRRAPLALALLNVPRCVLANKIHAALSALFCRMSAGTLPPAARWLTRAR